MRVLAIDPGTTESAFAVYEQFDSSSVLGRKVGNVEMAHIVADPIRMLGSGGAFIDALAIEMIASYGMPVGAEVFETCVWIGRFLERWPHGRTHAGALVYRRDVKLHLCGQARAKDGNVRQALIDRWGGKAAAIGTKAKPGPLYGFRADLWQALALAVTYSDTHSQTCGETDAPRHAHDTRQAVRGWE